MFSLFCRKRTIILHKNDFACIFMRKAFNYTEIVMKSEQEEGHSHLKVRQYMEGNNMHQFKKVSAAVIASILLVSACGCGKKDGNKKSGAKKNQDVEMRNDPDAVDVDRGGADSYDGADYDIEESTNATVDPDDVDWEELFTWDGKTITGVKEDGFSEAVKNTGVLVIPDKCESIGEKAFYEQDWVKEVRFEDPEKIVMIGNDAFENCTQLHSFVMPPNANIFQENNYLQEGTSPFGQACLMSGSTKLHNIVLPDGMVAYSLVNSLSNHWIDIPANNQTYMDAVFCPANFEVKIGSNPSPTMTFAKYTREFYEADYTQYGELKDDDVFPSSVCKVYVVEGSWADQHFEEWTFGDLIQKEYWDGKNYTFVENDPIWDVDDIVVHLDGNERVTFYGMDEAWQFIYYGSDGEKKLTGKITEEQFKTLYAEFMALVDDGTLSEDYYSSVNVHIDGYLSACDTFYHAKDKADSAKLKAIVDK